MRIAFADFCGWDFHASSVDEKPMGGSQSAACHLARALARDGHDAFLITNVSTPGTYGGVTSLSWNGTDVARLRALELDAFVCLLSPGNGVKLRQILGAQTKLILWNQHAHDQPAVQVLKDEAERAAYDGFAMVSEWQRTQYNLAFGVELSRMAVLRNAIAPTFADLFSGQESILAQKTQPPVMAYTSTPFRGLDLLLDAFGPIRKQVPLTRLRVYSSMKVYQTSAADDEAAYGALYERCRQTEGVEYVGSLPQPELARELKSTSVLAYPNSFAETSCISVMEALASGCTVVTSDLGALSETGAGLAKLIPVGQGRQAYLEQFVAQTVGVLRDVTSHSSAMDAQLRRQVDHVQRTTVWPVRSREWIGWLQGMAVAH